MVDGKSALIIANSHYQDPDLRQLVAPAYDAEALARVLGNPAIGGFDVKVLLDKPAREVSEEIEKFFLNRRRGDLLLLYFSGHGIKDDDGLLYFATPDTHLIEHSKPLKSSTVSADFVRDVMRGSKSRRQILVLDCCYSGAFAGVLMAKGDKSVGIRERFAEGRGMVVITASNALQYSFEGDKVEGEGQRSVFTRTMVEGIETGKADLNHDGEISLDELYEYVYEHVSDQTPEQRPKKWDLDVEGKIFLAHSPTLTPADLPPELLHAIASPLTSVRYGAIQELGILLRGPHKGLALAARQALTGLKDDDSRRISTAAADTLSSVEEAPVQPATKEASQPPRFKEPTQPAVPAAPAKALDVKQAPEQKVVPIAEAPLVERSHPPSVLPFPAQREKTEPIAPWHKTSALPAIAQVEQMLGAPAQPQAAQSAVMEAPQPRVASALTKEGKQKWLELLLVTSAASTAFMALFFALTWLISRWISPFREVLLAIILGSVDMCVLALAMHRVLPRLFAAKLSVRPALVASALVSVTGSLIFLILSFEEPVISKNFRQPGLLFTLIIFNLGFCLLSAIVSRYLMKKYVPGASLWRLVTLALVSVLSGTAVWGMRFFVSSLLEYASSHYPSFLHWLSDYWRSRILAFGVSGRPAAALASLVPFVYMLTLVSRNWLHERRKT